MEISELVEKKAMLEEELLRLLKLFKAETGFVPEVEVQYMDISCFAGQQKTEIASVKVKMELD